MNIKKEDRAQRGALTLLFAGVVFFIHLIVILAVGGALYLAVINGVISGQEEEMVNGPLIIGLMILNSLLLGAFMSFILGKYLMRPVNKIINGMNRLSSGDFRTRIVFPGIIGKHPTVKELTEGFNTMASELESTEMLRSDFVNNFSHEFETPIVSIAGFAKLLRRGSLSETEKQEYLEIIEVESLRLSYMVTNVLNMTKVENQSILTDVSRYNLSEQLRDCILLLESKWERKRLELDIDFDEYYIRADEKLLKQVWINLLDNAIKFTPEGGIVGVSVSRDAQVLCVSIRNTGSTIPPESMGRIFQKFYQGDPSRATEGNGIGLAIVKRVTELHGGTVSVESGNGDTVFEVCLPGN